MSQGATRRKSLGTTALEGHKSGIVIPYCAVVSHGSGKPLQSARGRERERECVCVCVGGGLNVSAHYDSPQPGRHRYRRH